MNRGRGVANRVGLAVTGAALCVLGGAALVRGTGAFGAGAAARPVLGGDVAALARDRLWFWPSVAAGGFLLAVAGLWWLSRRLRPDHVRRIRLQCGPRDRTEIAGGPAGQAVAAQVSAHPDVRRARAALRGSSRAPWLDLRLTARNTVNLDGLLAMLRQEAVPGLRGSLGLGRVPAVVRLGFVWEGRSRRRRGMRRGGRTGGC